ncbi:DNA-3-methyladenine glycosylase I [soil metagenome]
MKRCTWAEGSALMTEYHDSEWGVPIFDSGALYEMLMLEGFQAGLSWNTVLKKRDSFRKAFKNFDVQKVAKFTEGDIERLMQDEGVIRARAKIIATIGGANAYLKMQDDGVEFSDFIWSFSAGKPIQSNGKERIVTSDLSEQLSKELKKRGFKFVGPVIVYAFMQAVGIVNDHDAQCFRKNPCAAISA